MIFNAPRKFNDGYTFNGGVLATVELTKAAPSMQLIATYDNNIPADCIAVVGENYDDAALSTSLVDSPYTNTENLYPQNSIVWADGLILYKLAASGWLDTIPEYNYTNVDFGETNPLCRNSLGEFNEAVNIYEYVGSKFADTLPVKSFVGSEFTELADAKAYKSIVFNDSISFSVVFALKYNNSSDLYKVDRIVWGDAVGLTAYGKAVPDPVIPPGTTLPQYPPPPNPTPPTPPPRYVGSTTIDFQCEWHSDRAQAHNVIVDFAPWACPELAPVDKTVPIQKVYIVLNTFTMKRLKDNVPVKILNCTIEQGRTSWAWSLSANVPLSEMEKLEPDSDGMIEVQINVNGVLMNFVVEDYDLQEQFLQGSGSISGRSLTCYLDVPYSALASFVQTTSTSSVALANAELARAGAPDIATGFTLDWSLVSPTGWPVPADSWSYQNQSPVGSLLDIVQSVGGYLNSDPTAKKFYAKSSYPVAPWHINDTGVSPDIVIPRSIAKLSSSQNSNNVQYNSIIVSGQNKGVVASVSLSGSIYPTLASGIAAPMYSHPLITDVTSAYEKAQSVFAGGGMQGLIQIDTPINTSIGMGLVVPGSVVEINGGHDSSYSTWRGLNRDTKIVVQTSGKSGQITVTQSIYLERHY